MASSSGLYLQLFSVHGLIRGESPELGRDADTGGQVKYVLELARALAEDPRVDQVDLVTRLIVDKAVSREYARPVEPLSDKARIVRIQCGGRRYIRKELLWPHLDEMVDKALKFVKAEGRIPDIFHGHYADGGYVARNLASIFGAPFIFTGHSLGRHKKNRLMAEGMSEEETVRRYRIDHRIDVEERVIKEAERIITSTSHEISEQYGLYDNSAAGRYRVIPPGIDIRNFFPFYEPYLVQPEGYEQLQQTHISLLHELHRFWVDPQKPFILALCRPDKRKNISGLVTAYGEDKELRAIANLAIFAGIRKDISQMEENEQGVLTEMLLLMDQYDLYGKMAIPKTHDFSIEVPELYRLCAASIGVFVNAALLEPFGLTLIEAAACGVPIVATREGGPVDIIGNCDNGILIDPANPEEIARAIKKILVDRKLWEQFSSNGVNGVRAHYSWSRHCDRTLELINEVLAEMPATELDRTTTLSPGRRLTNLKKLVFSDIDNTLVGDTQALYTLLDLFDVHQDYIGWGVATGRCLGMTVAALRKHNIPVPDILICSVGSEIFYGPDITPDRGWQQHLSYQWKRNMIKEALDRLDFLDPQEEEAQHQFKISYYMKDDPDLLARVHQTLQLKKLRYQLVFSHGQFLDILPYRASKGRAIRYLSYKWGFPLQDILTCGDSGNDEDMLRGDTSGVVVGNYSRELLHLKGRRRIYFSSKKYANAIIDGLRRYNFI
ncbi:MAG: HAD-IIB family hydrolase [Desulfobacterales bacterium]|nr:HAD-IIB family hydrolase [Desulfobacterales bacterium]